MSYGSLEELDLEDFGFQSMKSVQLFPMPTPDSQRFAQHFTNLLTISLKNRILVAAFKDQLKVLPLDSLSAALTATTSSDSEENNEDNGEDAAIPIEEVSGVYSTTFDYEISQLCMSSNEALLYVIRSNDKESSIPLIVSACDTSSLAAGNLSSNDIHVFDDEVVNCAVCPIYWNLLVCLLKNGELWCLDLTMGNGRLASLIQQDVSGFGWNDQDLVVGYNDGSLKFVSITADGQELPVVLRELTFQDLEPDQKPFSIVKLEPKSWFAMFGNTLDSSEDEDFDYKGYVVTDSGNDFDVKETTDICQPWGVTPRMGSFYSAILHNWSKQYPHLAIVTASKSTEFNTLTSTQQIQQLNDYDRAQLSMDPVTDDDDTPLGIVMDLCATKQVFEPSKAVDECGPLPRVIAMTNRGQLLTWNVWYSRDINNSGVDLPGALAGALQDIKNAGTFQAGISQIQEDTSETVEVALKEGTPGPQSDSQSISEQDYESSSDDEADSNPQGNMFGSNFSQPKTGSIFGMTNTASNPFGSSQTASNPFGTSTANPFGSKKEETKEEPKKQIESQEASPFGQSGFKFGSSQPEASSTMSFGKTSFGSTPAAPTAPASGAFGTFGSSTATGGFGKFRGGSPFGTAAAGSGASPFASAASDSKANLFSGASSGFKSDTKAFGSISTGGDKPAFGNSGFSFGNNATTASVSMGGEKSAFSFGDKKTTSSSSIFGSKPESTPPFSNSLFGASASTSTSQSPFASLGKAPADATKNSPFENHSSIGASLNTTNSEKKESPFASLGKVSMGTEKRSPFESLGSVGAALDDTTKDETKLSPFSLDIKTSEAEQKTSFDLAKDSKPFSFGTFGEESSEAEKKTSFGLAKDSKPFSFGTFGEESSEAEKKTSFGLAKDSKPFSFGTLGEESSEAEKKTSFDLAKDSKPFSFGTLGEESSEAEKKTSFDLAKDSKPFSFGTLGEESSEAEKKPFGSASVGSVNAVTDSVTPSNDEEKKSSKYSSPFKIETQKTFTPEAFTFGFTEDKKQQSFISSQIEEVASLTPEEQLPDPEPVNSSVVNLPSTDDEEDFIDVSQASQVEDEEDTEIQTSDVENNVSVVKEEDVSHAIPEQLSDDELEVAANVSDASVLVEQTNEIHFVDDIAEPEDGVPEQASDGESEVGLEEKEVVPAKLNENVVSEASSGTESILKDDAEVGSQRQESDNGSAVQSGTSEESFEEIEKPDSITSTKTEGDDVVAVKETMATQAVQKSAPTDETLETDEKTKSPESAEKYDSPEISENGADALPASKDMETNTVLYKETETEVTPELVDQAMSTEDPQIAVPIDAEPKYVHTELDIVDELQELQIQAFEDDEIYLSELSVPLPVPSLTSLKSIDYPPFSKESVLKEIEKIVYDTDAEFQILGMNIKDMNEYLKDHLNAELKHTETTLAFPAFWRSNEVGTVANIVQQKSWEFWQMKYQLDSTFASVRALSVDLSKTFKSLNGLKYQLKVVNDAEAAKSSKKSAPLSPADFQRRNNLRKKLEQSKENGSQLQSKLMMLNSLIQPDQLVKNPLQFEVILSNIDARTRSHIHSIKNLQAEIKALSASPKGFSPSGAISSTDPDASSDYGLNLTENAEKLRVASLVSSVSNKKLLNKTLKKRSFVPRQFH